MQWTSRAEPRQTWPGRAESRPTAAAHADQRSDNGPFTWGTWGTASDLGSGARCRARMGPSVGNHLVPSDRLCRGSRIRRATCGCRPGGGGGHTGHAAGYVAPCAVGRLQRQGSTECANAGRAWAIRGLIASRAPRGAKGPTGGLGRKGEGGRGAKSHTSSSAPIGHDLYLGGETE